MPLLKEMSTGKPKKDPSTGYLMSHALPSTDVTKIADKKGYAASPLSFALETLAMMS